jgi:hypothetical protein
MLKVLALQSPSVFVDGVVLSTAAYGSRFANFTVQFRVTIILPESGRRH